ncbi:hypothetical protein Poli38472_003232 [Pythium oligandrum]|uniref:CFA20 domain-containing protein n=1 Tax=Pythium oligandrum TaxID=41045 RepID=A0A8K1C692_PYTOL|nr:hypothetical protein Poli38472_003232 [Pythium oligandrum]|eukprot:TMW57307.1 hypothetical protein Poli38472_003232 [Pythium oligandrum]
MTSPRPVWQEPYVEVLRHGLAHRSVGWQQQGDVEQVSDALIHKNVFKIRGTIAATNYMRIPRDVVQGTYGLGLTGRYVYIQLRRVRDLPLLLHMDLVTSKKTTLRFSLSSMYTALRSTGTVLRVPLQLNKSWTTVVIDMVELLACHTFNDYCRENYRCLKAVTCCAAMNLRNVFISSTLYTTETLPVALALPVAYAAQGGPYVWLSLPADEMKNHAASHRKTPTKARQRNESDFEEVEDTTSETEFFVMLDSQSDHKNTPLSQVLITSPLQENQNLRLPLPPGNL